MTTLITGGGSQVGIGLAHLLAAANHKVLFASRSGRVPDGFASVKFDWADPSTFETPFNTDSDVRNVYLLAPVGVWEPLPLVKPFIDLAVEKGVKKFVFLSASGADKGPGSLFLGTIHTYLDTLGVDYVVLRPTWFLENFSKGYRKSIQEHNVIETTVPTGRISFVAVADISQAAFDAIVNPGVLPSNEPRIIGRDFLSYNEVAEVFSNVLGRKITHRVVDKEEGLRRYITYGLEEEAARGLVGLEEGVERGSELKWLADPITVVGKIGAKDWIENHKDLFVASN